MIIPVLPPSPHNGGGSELSPEDAGAVMALLFLLIGVLVYLAVQGSSPEEPATLIDTDDRLLVEVIAVEPAERLFVDLKVVETSEVCKHVFVSNNLSNWQKRCQIGRQTFATRLTLKRDNKWFYAWPRLDYQLPAQ